MNKFEELMKNYDEQGGNEQNSELDSMETRANCDACDCCECAGSIVECLADVVCCFSGM